jgi:hypothetical protein
MQDVANQHHVERPGVLRDERLDRGHAELDA